MQLKQVVLPAPFGPIRPVIWPCAASNETSVSALMPPNRIVKSRTESRDATAYFVSPIDEPRVSVRTPIGDQSVPSQRAVIICVIGKRNVGVVRMMTPG